MKTKSTRTILDLGRLGVENAVLLGKYAYHGASSSLPLHVHENIMEIVYCERGQQVYEVGQEQFVIRGGDVFVTFPNELHSTANHPEEKGVVYWLQVEIPADNSHFLGYSGSNACGLLNALRNLPGRHFRGNVQIRKCMDEIFRLGKGNFSDYTRVSIHICLAQLLQSVVGCSEAARAHKGNNLRIESVKKFIEEHLDTHLSISRLAAHQQISQSHFKKWFKNESGLTPMDYIQRRKVERAKKTLAHHKEYNVMDIAYQLNFSSSQYFATVFKKYAGLTPLEYRGRFQ
ncbi:HTH-type transcriptional activator RhaR [Dyadobacter sp. CECT 9275]|uniref:HTH-type transcriptional activator RhaR n=1 Tax=Dyadobacter helix TaxID=2822344 RepID=A0A916NCN5_9BACT|nr:AraC family transcriptional regulator [Dyadobacter sp. CECT 9275]CAG5003093.1 HTH-type transcriptional activator RhaR [Dyadobacter sp. CECT 9275]